MHEGWLANRSCRINWDWAPGVFAVIRTGHTNKRPCCKKCYAYVEGGVGVVCQTMEQVFLFYRSMFTMGGVLTLQFATIN